MKFRKDYVEKREKCIKETRIVWDKANMLSGILTLGCIRIILTQYECFSPEFCMHCIVLALVAGPIILLEDFVMRAPGKVAQRIPSYGAEIDVAQYHIMSTKIIDMLPERLEKEATILVDVTKLGAMIAAILIIPWDFSLLISLLLANDVAVLPFLMHYTFYMCRDYYSVTKRKSC